MGKTIPAYVQATASAMRAMCFLSVLVFWNSHLCIAQTENTLLVRHEPKPCVGFNGSEHDTPWGELKEGVCPPHHGVFGVNRAGRASNGKRRKRVECCPLPSSDILLTEESVQSTGTCPESYIITGPTNAPPADCPECELRTRCTKINVNRYMLGETTFASAWGIGASTWKERSVIQKRDIPVAIRFSSGRVSAFEWLPQSCIGLPFGALLVSTDGVQCDEFAFRQLQYRGLPGDPPRGTPVRMFPACRRLSDKFDPHPVCLR